MQVLIFGAGALGSLVGAFVAGRHTVHLVGRREHVQAIQKQGLTVEGLRRFTVQCQASETVPPDLEPDLIIVATKAHATDDAVKALAPSTPPGTLVLTIQNGLGNIERLRDGLPQARILGASCTYAAMLAGPGRVVFTGAGEIRLGGTIKELDAAGTVARLLRESGLNALGLPDIQGAVWLKAIVNAAVNPIAAIHGKTNGEILDDSALMERVREVAEESAKVARAAKVALPEKDVYAKVRKILEASRANRSSMLEDLAKGRRTEIDAINGVFVQRGKDLGIPTPKNEELLLEIRKRERG